MPTAFFRLTKRNPPTTEDFRSYAEEGKVAEDDPPEIRRLKDGISVNATLRQARNRARGVPSLRDHEFIAELHIPDGSAITFERTGRQAGHHTLWGSSEDLLACVVSVVRLDAVD